MIFVAYYFYPDHADVLVQQYGRPMWVFVARIDQDGTVTYFE